MSIQLIRKLFQFYQTTLYQKIDLNDNSRMRLKSLQNIDLKPFYKNKKTPCSYCDYKSICNFNNGACLNKYNFIDEKSKQEILEKIKIENRYGRRQKFEKSIK